MCLLLKIDPDIPSDMTLDEKVRYGMLALTGAGIVFAALGLHLGPIDVTGSTGSLG
jgi:hypothetical protein